MRINLKWMLLVGMALAAQGQAAELRQLTCHGADPKEGFQEKNYFIFLRYQTSGDADVLAKAVSAQGSLRLVVTEGGKKIQERTGTFQGGMTPILWYGGALDGKLTLAGEQPQRLLLFRELGSLSTKLAPSDVRMKCLDEKIR